jgi:hypothetical protein
LGAQQKPENLERLLLDADRRSVPALEFARCQIDVKVAEESTKRK